MPSSEEPLRLISIRILITSVGFGAAGAVLLLAGLTIPIIGTGLSMDPHEIFITLGSAFGGPVGGAITALIADVARPASPFKVVLVAAHIVSGISMGLAYKTLVHRRLKMPWMLAGWAGLVFAYYLVLIVPTLPILRRLGFFPPELLAELSGGEIWALYGISFVVGGPEILVTVGVTTLVMALLPPKYRRPLW